MIPRDRVTKTITSPVMLIKNLDQFLNGFRVGPVRAVTGAHGPVPVLAPDSGAGPKCASVTVQGTPANNPNRHHTQRTPNAYSHRAFHMEVGTQDQTGQHILHK